MNMNQLPAPLKKWNNPASDFNVDIDILAECMLPAHVVQKLPQDGTKAEVLSVRERLIAV